jgi:3-methylfumaryl-CoA hydratase
MINLDELKLWRGRVECRTEVLSAAPLRGLAATLDREDPEPRPGDSIPPCWHWLYFLPLHRHSEIGPDGHVQRGSFLPPVPLPRRMWASSRIEFRHPLRVGESVTKTSRVVEVHGKEGRNGPLVFVRIQHKIEDSTGLAVVEEQDIVYRDQPKSGGKPASETSAPPGNHEWSRQIQTGPVLLFRYSALTFNAHRIHYDRLYATEVEGYPGLVVHGPLIATLLLDLLRRSLPDAELAHFSFRAMKPTFEATQFLVCGRRGVAPKTVHLWAQHLDGALAMDATAGLR